MEQTERAPRRRGDDTASIDAIVTALYDTISGPAGRRDWDRLRTLYLPGAQLLAGAPDANGHVTFETLDPESYARSRDAIFGATDFYEREIARRTERYGCIAHVFSTYESRTSREGPVVMRGVNAIQLLWKDERWWVASMAWQHEGPALPIPARYFASDDAGSLLDA